MTKRQVCSTYAVRAVSAPEAPGWFHASFDQPGKDRQAVVSRYGEPMIYASRKAAQLAAAEALIDVLNRRTKGTRRGLDYERIPAADLCRWAGEHHMGPKELAHLFGTNEARVKQWMTGDDTAPYHVGAMVFLCRADPANLVRLRQTADAMAAAASQRYMEEKAK